MKKYLVIGLLLFFVIYDFGVLIPWIISTNQIPLFSIVFFMVMHVIFYTLIFVNINNFKKYLF